MSGSPVLLIEDHADARLIVSAALRRHGFHVTESRDGEEGLQLAQAHRPLAVVTDLHLPKLDGCGVIQALKQAPDTAEIATVMLTVDARPETLDAAKAAGCDAFVVKPSPPAQLVETVRRLLDVYAMRIGAKRPLWEQEEIAREMQAGAAELELHRLAEEREADRKWVRDEVLGMLRSGWTWTALAEIGFTEALLEEIGFDVEAPVAEWFNAEQAGRLR